MKNTEKYAEDETLKAIYEFAGRNNIEVFEELPEDYKITEGALTAPTGSTWINNGKAVDADQKPFDVGQDLKALLNKYGYTDVSSLDDGSIIISGRAKVNLGFYNLTEVEEFVNGIDELCTNGYTPEQLQIAMGKGPIDEDEHEEDPEITKISGRFSMIQYDQAVKYIEREAAVRFAKEYADKMDKLIEENVNFLIEDSSIFPFEVRDGFHAAIRYGHISRKDIDEFDNIKDAESGVAMNITAAIYRDKTINQYDQGIEEIKFTLKGTKAIDDFCDRIDLDVKNSIKAHPDIQPVVTINYSEYDKVHLLAEHTRLSLDQANSLFGLIDMVVRDETKTKEYKGYYKTSADIMFVKDGSIGHYDLRQDFGDGDGSMIHHIEKMADKYIWQMERSKQPDASKHLEDWKNIKEKLIPYFNQQISIDTAERNLELLPRDQAEVMRGKISEMRTFLNTGEITVSEQVSAREESDFSRQVDEVLDGKADRYNDIKVCDTPDILQKAGCRNLPVFYSQRHLHDAIKEKNPNGHTHGLKVDQIKRIPELISNPVMIYDSLSRSDCIVVVTSETDQDKSPIVAAIRPNGTAKYQMEIWDSNYMLSIHGRDNFENQMEQALKQNKILYCDKQKSQELFSVLGLQLSKGFNNLDFDKIIHQSNNIVKNETPGKENETVTGHPEFKIQYYEGNEKKSIYADKLESGFETIRNNNTDLKETDRCYVGIYNGESGKYVPADIYLIKSGENVTPVPLELPNIRSKENFIKLTSGIKALGARFDGKHWTAAKNLPPENLKKINDLIARFDPDKTYLTLPAMGKEKFKMLTEKLKEDGARFDPVRKQWYITKACDREKFNDYISGERSSVLGKLQDAQNDVADKAAGSAAGIEHEDKELPV